MPTFVSWGLYNSDENVTKSLVPYTNYCPYCAFLNIWPPPTHPPTPTRRHMAGETQWECRTSSQLADSLSLASFARSGFTCLCTLHISISSTSTWAPIGNGTKDHCSSVMLRPALERSEEAAARSLLNTQQRGRQLQRGESHNPLIPASFRGWETHWVYSKLTYWIHRTSSELKCPSIPIWIDPAARLNNKKVKL